MAGRHWRGGVYGEGWQISTLSTYPRTSKSVPIEATPVFIYRFKLLTHFGPLKCSSFKPQVV
jgi:hypothetical protein